MACFISPISIGLGDLIVSLPAIQSIIESGEKTYLVTRSNLQYELAARIKRLAGVIVEDEFKECELSSSDEYINLREHPLQKDFWWGSPDFDRQYPSYKINDLLAIICRDFDIDADFEQLEPLQFFSVNEVKEAVAFIPGSDSNYKCWTKQHWLNLASLFKLEGVEIVMIGNPESSQAVEELLPYLTWLPTPNVTDALDFLSSVKAVVAVDTGLMHLAVHQGTPTIGLYRSHPIYKRDYAKNFALTARVCDARCLEKSLNYTYNQVTDMSGFKYQSWQCQADAEQFCMSSISAESVFAIAKTNPDLFLPIKSKVF